MTDKDLIRIKGGCWVNYEKYCRTAVRLKKQRDLIGLNRGFRIMLREKNEIPS